MRVRVWTRAGWPLVDLVVAAALMTGCGSDNGEPPPTPPTPPTASRAFVHVLSPPATSQWWSAVDRYSFEVTAPAGTLRLLASQERPLARRIAADPSGRFLFIASTGGQDDLRAYAFNPASGEWTTVSNASLSNRDDVSDPAYPVALGANESRVLLSRGYEFGSDAFAVDRDTGAFSLLPWGFESWSDYAWFVLPPASPFVYADYGGQGIVVLSSQQGQLTFNSAVQTAGDHGRAFDAAYTAGCLVATFRTGVTAAGAVSGGIVSYVADAATGRLAQAGTVDGLVAWHVAGAARRVAVTTSTQLLTFELNGSCRMTSGAVADIRGPTQDDYYAGSLAFHPSGDFLYVDQPDGLHNYMLLGDHALRPLETIAGVHGRVVAAPPPS